LFRHPQKGEDLDSRLRGNDELGKPPAYLTYPDLDSCLRGNEEDRMTFSLADNFGQTPEMECVVLSVVLQALFSKIDKHIALN